jgi:hypothetical protein
MTRRRKSLADIRDFTSELYEQMNENGDFDGTTLEDEKFTIVQGWEAWNTFVTNVIHFAGLYPLYKPAIQFELSERFPPKLVINHAPSSKPKELREIQYGDLRLGRNGLHPGDHKEDEDEGTKRWGATPYLVPEIVQPVEEILEEIVGEWGFSDEYGTCDNCHKALRTSPDSYGWTPDYVEISDGRYCLECTDVDEVLEEYCRKRKGIPYQIEKKAMSEGTIILMGKTWDNGLHSGMNDDPKKIAKALKAMGLTEWWWHLEPSQFYVEFKILLRQDAIDILAKVWDESKAHELRWTSGDDFKEDEAEEKANAVLEHIDAYQGYDQATEMSKALRGEHTDHITMITTQLDMGDPKVAEAWVEGRIMEVARAKAEAEAGVQPLIDNGNDDDDEDV